MMILSAGITPAEAAGESADFVLGQPSLSQEPPLTGITGSLFKDTGRYGGNPSARGVAVDASGNVAVGDFSRILIFPAGSNTATKVLGQEPTGTNFSINNQHIFNGSSDRVNGLGIVRGLDFDTTGNLWVADSGSNSVKRYPKSGATWATQPDFVIGSPNLPNGATNQLLYEPVAVKVDGSGNVYIAENGNNRVTVFSANSTTAFRVYGQPDFTSKLPNNSASGRSASTLNRPTGVEVDSTGRVYIADKLNNRVLSYPAGSTVADKVYGQKNYNIPLYDILGEPTDVAVVGDLLVVSNTLFSKINIWKLDASGQCFDGSTGQPTAGNCNFNNYVDVRGQNNLNASTGGINIDNTGAKPNSMYYPTALAVGSNLQVYIADSNNARIIRHVLTSGGGSGGGGTPTPGNNFFAVTPTRLFDSRNSVAFNPATNPTRTIRAVGQAGIPAGAAAIVANVTVAQAQGGGYVKAYAANIGEPNISTVNWYNSPQGLGARTVASFALIGLDANGDFKITVGGGTTHVIVDVAGYTKSDSTGGVFKPANGRLYDSRNAPEGTMKNGETRIFKTVGFAGIPVTAKFVVVNLTAVQTVGGGYFAAYPDGGSVPNISSVNWYDNNAAGNVAKTVANLAIVPVSSETKFKVTEGGTPGSSAHLVIDVLGYIDGVSGTTGSFYPVAPFRLFDSRNGAGGLTNTVSRQHGVQGQGGIPFEATSVVVRITTVDATGGGFFHLIPGNTSWTDGSTVNTTGATQQMGNIAIVPLGDGGIKAYRGGAGSGYILDVIGYIK
jgi:hypothetical protein